MAGLLWDKADARISNDELAEINEWAQKHAEVCPWMGLIVQGAWRNALLRRIQFRVRRNRCGCLLYLRKTILYGLR